MITLMVITAALLVAHKVLVGSEVRESRNGVSVLWAKLTK
jgi:hypothetical protein